MKTCDVGVDTKMSTASLSFSSLCFFFFFGGFRPHLCLSISSQHFTHCHGIKRVTFKGSCVAHLINFASGRPDLAVIAFNFLFDRTIKVMAITTSGNCSLDSVTSDDDREGTLMTHTHMHRSTHLLNEKKQWGLKMPSFPLSPSLPLIIPAQHPVLLFHSSLYLPSLLLHEV